MKYIYYDKNLVKNEFFEEYNNFKSNEQIIKYTELSNDSELL